MYHVGQHIMFLTQRLRLTRYATVLDIGTKTLYVRLEDGREVRIWKSMVWEWPKAVADASVRNRVSKRAS